MRLEGTLDAFSLPDIFQLLSYTKKTGTLHLRRDGQHGVVHVRDGAVTGGRSDAAQQALGRRLVGAGVVDDEDLADAAEKVVESPGLGLGRALVELGAVERDLARDLAQEQARDAVFELLRWPDGEFAFVVDEPDPDDVGVSLSVEEAVAEGHRRVQAWAELSESIQSPNAVVSMVPSPTNEPLVSREEWALLALIDGTRSVNDLVSLSGTSDFVVLSVLSALVDRGLVAVGAVAAGDDPLRRRKALLDGLDVGGLEAAPPPAREEAAPAQAVPAARESAPAAASFAPRNPVIPERLEPFTAPRRPEHAEPVFARQTPASTAGPGNGASVGAVQGAHALASEPAPASYIDRDPAVNKSLLLRLIAGVRGL